MKNLMLIILAASAVFAAQFPDIRYPAPADFKRLLWEKFPLAVRANSLACLGLERPEIQRIVGVNDPATGEPTVREPGPAFIRWYVPCLKQIIDVDFNEDYFTEATRIALQTAFERSEKALKGPNSLKPSQQSMSWLLSFDWKKLKDTEQLAVINDLINHLIGPGVLAPMEQAKLADQLWMGYYKIKGINERFQSVTDAGKKISLGIVLRDEFLLSPL
ncbi:MAG: hypothetical protein ABL958_03670 [Bdellovibrionia bacterium]